jgi:low affinity Fe/Cu permease
MHVRVDRSTSEIGVCVMAYGDVAKRISHWCGRPTTFLLALGVIVTWILTGPIFGYSDTWQLVINTGTTIITFLMVFLIQNTQNRDTAAIQLKLDELIRATQGAHNALLDLEELDETVLEEFRTRYERLARDARAGLAVGQVDTGAPEP